MVDFELPLGKRSLKYRLFEMIPGVISYGAFALLIILSIASPLLAGIYLLLIIITVLVKTVLIVRDSIIGHSRLDRAQKVDWAKRLADFEDPKAAYERHYGQLSKDFGALAHIDNLRLVTADLKAYPKPSALYNMVIIATYNETFEVLAPTIQSLIDTTYPKKQFIVVLAYEERGGKATEHTARRLQNKFKDSFYEFLTIKHPGDLPNEVVGKGGNITFAGKEMASWCKDRSIAFKDVMITTLDADNRPHPAYFDYTTYEFITSDDRQHYSYQPIALFLNNIWDVPAPMRVVATGNTFWSIISATRPHTMRNFASHSQPMQALVEMDWWSTRTVVEDGHQFWRSYVHFKGKYAVIPMYIPIYQDAVLSNTLTKTLKAQFVQLRRWMYGASDIAYMASQLFTSKRTVPFWNGFVWFVRALDGYVTAASVSIIVAVGAWIPLLINSGSYNNIVAHQLPDVVSTLQRVALIGLVILVFQAFKLLPPRPARYKRHRSVGMVLQWVLMPITAIVYLSFAALSAQGRLMFGKYLDKFDVTDKATHESAQAAKQRARALKHS